MGAVAPALAAVGQLEVRLVNESSGRERSTVAVRDEASVRYCAQFVVGKNDKIVDGCLTHVVFRHNSP